MAFNRTVVTVPRKVLTAWKIADEHYPRGNRSVEITFLPDEAAKITAWLPTLVKNYENGEFSNLAEDFPFEIARITATNLWTQRS